MGLLDEAIREHLELKRRRGADASEVARQESEALGPDTRVPEALEVPQPAVEDYPAEPAEALAEPIDAPPVEAEPVSGIAPQPHEVMDPGPVPEAESPPPEIPGQIRIDDPDVGQPHNLDEAVPPSAVGQPTAEFDVPAHHDGDPQPAAEPVAPEPGAPAPAPPSPPQAHDPESPAPEGQHPDDVLEETPEFLQETPEHDRLWFEQRPPRDFDFDK